MTDPAQNIPSQKNFINMAFWFEGSLIGVAWLIGWFVNINPIADLSLESLAFFWGIAGTIPLFLLFLLFYQYPIGPLYAIKKSLLDILGPILAMCRWYELIILATVAGISEEVLFRGVLQPWLEKDYGLTGGIVISNIIFGLLHWITPVYALIAGLIGGYLAYMMEISGTRNLLTPIIIHGLYDYLAFVVVAIAYRLQQESE